ncbi:MAG: dipeptidase PepE [Bacteroidales bacterium]|nr:dipeptidase PepE [Bacteroidales bacterium]
MKLLLLSNSTNAGEEYLDYAKDYIRSFLGTKPNKLVFIPYAGVTITWDDYSNKVAEKFLDIGYTIFPIHKQKNAAELINQAEAIVIGGGNTFSLLYHLQKKNLIQLIYKKVYSGMPYIGWSAGSNLACPTIRTTNDMPVIEPENFAALNLIPFQINPHYTDVNPEGHAGETRQMRIEEFIEINPDIYVTGLREGTALQISGSHVKLLGRKSLRIFKKGIQPYELSNENNLDFLIK